MSSPQHTASRSVPNPSKVEKPFAISTNEPHELECRIQRALQSHPGLKFSRLTVHQCPQGVCLEGVLDSNEQDIDLCELVNELAGINAINRVVTQSTINIPR